jgi:hypothetical protein
MMIIKSKQDTQLLSHVFSKIILLNAEYLFIDAIKH